MALRSSVLVGPTHLMAFGHPFVTPQFPDVQGVPIGIDIFSRQVMYFDPWMLKKFGLIGSGYGLFMGKKGGGKSTLMKIIALRLMIIAAGYYQMRVAINDYKPEGKLSEYGAFTKVANSTTFKMGSSAVNPFDRRLYSLDDDTVYELGILSVAERICEFVNGDTLKGEFGRALRIAVDVMLNLDPSLWSLHQLHKIVRSLTKAQINGYFRTIDSRVQKQHEARIELVKSPVNREAALLQLSSLHATRDNTLHADIQMAGNYVATLLERVLYGSYGKMFGETGSLYDMSTQRAVTRDWRGVAPEPEALMRTITTDVQTAAIETNRLDLLPHLELDDEKHKSMDLLAYARAHSFFSEIARATHTCNLSATHRLASMRKGGVGSELYNLANSIINNLGFVGMTQQQNEPAALQELAERYDISSRRDLELITMLPDYTFAMKVGDQPLRFIRTFVTPMESALIGTDDATDRMTARPDVLSEADISLFAETNGIGFVGMQAA